MAPKETAAVVATSSGTFTVGDTFELIVEFTAEVYVTSVDGASSDIGAPVLQLTLSNATDDEGDPIPSVARCTRYGQSIQPSVKE